MTSNISIGRIRLVVVSAIAMTLGAEFFYLIVFGMVLFPTDDITPKIVWTMTCGIAMGAVIGTGVLLAVQNHWSEAVRFLVPAGIVAIVGSYCAWLCSWIDASFNYFGGAENPVLFVLSGVLPAIAGGAIYGWIVKDDRFVAENV